MDSVLTMALGKAQQLYADVVTNDFMMVKLKVSLNGIIEGLISYQDLSLESGPSKTIDGVLLAIEGAEIGIEKVKSRSGWRKYWYGINDLRDIEDCVDILETALKALQTKISLANEGAIRSTNITLEEINRNAMNSLRHTESGIIFWRDFVSTKSWTINTQQASFYAKQFIIAQNARLPVEKQIRTENLQLVLARLFDRDNSGSVTPDEIAHFFHDIWDDEKTRARINLAQKSIVKDEDDHKQYLLVKQFCKELGLDYYYDVIKSKGVTTKMLLNSNLESLSCAFKEIEPEHLALIHMKAKAHNERKEFFIDIMNRAKVVERDGRLAAQEVEDALAAGKLKEVMKDNNTYWIEDPVGGNGLCVFKNNKKEQMLCRRRDWKAHGFPGRYTNNEGNSFYIMAYSNYSRMGPYVFYSEKRQEIHYCSKSEKGDSVYKIICHGKQGQMSFEASKLINGYYEPDGETIIVENDNIEYKKYFSYDEKKKAPIEVDWDEYKRNRPQDRLDLSKLEEIMEIQSHNCSTRASYVKR